MAHFIAVLVATLGAFGGFYLLGWLVDEVFAVTDASRRSYEQRVRRVPSAAAPPARGK